MSLSDLSPDALAALHGEQTTAYAALAAQGLKLDLTRGKPAPAQLDLSNALLTLPGEGEYKAADGTDCRNYGGGSGSAGDPRDLRRAAQRAGRPAGRRRQRQPRASCTTPWCSRCSRAPSTRPSPGSKEPITFLCPVPGYDRHFALCEQYGITMEPGRAGRRRPRPGGDPGGSSPTTRASRASGSSRRTPTRPASVYTEDVDPRARLDADRGARLPDLLGQRVRRAPPHRRRAPALDVLGLAAEAGNPNRVFVFASTSKITFAGAGVSFFAGSPANVAWYLQHLGKRTIGPDKVNQLRHVALPAATPTASGR